jgi:hypothetical protein
MVGPLTSSGMRARAGVQVAALSEGRGQGGKELAGCV